MKPVFQFTLCLSLLIAALPAAALAAEQFTPPAGLALWLKADAGITKDAANKITEWKDQSAAGNHATNANAATAPVFTTQGGQSFAHFEQKPGYTLRFNKPIPATGFTVVAAVRFGEAPFYYKQSSGQEQEQYAYWLGGDNGVGCYAGGGEAHFHPFQWELGGWGMWKSVNNGVPNLPWLLTSEPHPTDLGVVSLTNKHLYRNMLDIGLPLPNGKQPYLFFWNYVDGIEFNTLGANGSSKIPDAYGKLQPFTGDIFEVFVFNKSLTTGERVKVESYLMSRYNLPKPTYSTGAPPKSGLALWLKADAGITKDAANKITAWQDQSGAGRHATNADAATAPVFVTEGGKSFARFDKTNLLNCAVSAENFTVFAAIRTKQPFENNNFGVCWFGGGSVCLLANGNGPEGGLGGGVRFGWQPPNRLDVYGGVIQLKTADTGFIVTTLNNYQVWRNGSSDADIIRNDNKYEDIHVSGRDYRPMFWSVPGINLSRLGGLATTFAPDPGFRGDIAEVLIYNQTLLPPERGMVEEYLLNKYSIGPATPVRKAPALIARAAPVLNGLQLQLPGSGVYAIDIFTPRGTRAGSFQIKAPGAFDLSKAGLSNGVYQIRVRAGADIFWLKAPVVR